MYAFLSNLRPCSANKPRSRSERYTAGIQAAFGRYHDNAVPLSGNLYGTVYYFHRIPTQLDADNLSKPIWDALEDFVYSDDNAVKLRTAGILDLRSETLDVVDVLDLSLMPDSVMTDFLKMIDNNEHILYIEVGELDYSLFKFGSEEIGEV